MTGLWLVSYIALWVLFVIVAIVLISALHHLGIIYQIVDKRYPPPTKLAAGKVLPEVSLCSLDGNQVLISEFFGNRTAFTIIDPGCSSCLNLLKKIASDDIMAELPNQRMVIVSLRDVPTTLEMLQQAEPLHSYPILIDTDNTLREVWGINATPIILEVDDELRLSRQTTIHHSLEPSSVHLAELR